MNKARRAQINAAIDQLEALKSSLEQIKVEATQTAELLESITDEEQEAFDNMPESLQNSDKGQTAQEGLDGLDTAKTDLAAFIDSLADVDLDDLVSTLDNAKGC